MALSSRHAPIPTTERTSARSEGRALLRDNGLSLVLGALFLVFLVGQTWTGLLEHNDDLASHGQSTVTLRTYLASGHFIEATAENWESEFLQMAAYVLLTVVLFQRGSAESKRIGDVEAVDRDPRLSRHRDRAPWPVRRGGWILRIYENSLSLAFVLLFLVSFALHAVGGAWSYNIGQAEHGGAPLSILGYLATSQFWFESFQNWQSEFLSLVGMVVLSVFLRQRGSPESKPVDAPHTETGSE
jgi:hypothetical protein